MATASKIEWTEQTWNPIVGCSIVSPGCTNCYAMKDAYRKGFNPKTPSYHGLTKQVNGNAVWTGVVREAPEATLLAPLKRKKPTMYFVNSMSDLFHESIPDAWIDRVFAVMALTPQHTYQVLTKRAERMREYFQDTRAFGDPAEAGWAPGAKASWHIRQAMTELRSIEGMNLTDDQWSLYSDDGRIELPLPNVWLGVSTERQKEADERIPHLLQTPAAVRFISAEPLLGPINIDAIPYKLPSDISEHGEPPILGLDWVIVGGESGPGARPMHPQWARDLRDQCKAAGVPFFFKQWGAWADHTDADRSARIPVEEHIFTASGEVLGVGVMHGRHGMVEADWKEKGGAWMGRVGKKSAGRLLDGQEHSAMPGRE